MNDSIRKEDKIMKNKYQKLHRIVIGKSGSGKSFYILANVKEDNKINIICYPEAIGTYTDVYKKAFPGIFLSSKVGNSRLLVSEMKVLIFTAICIY